MAEPVDKIACGGLPMEFPAEICPHVGRSVNLTDGGGNAVNDDLVVG